MLNFENGDGLARIVLRGDTGGSTAGQVYVPQWDQGQRPWFTTLLYGFAYQQPTLWFNIEGAYLKWNCTIAGWGAATTQYVCGVW